jgi:hypothetical protein
MKQKMKRLVRNALIAMVGFALAGCEWSGSGDDNSWNDRYNFVNFSGTYKGVGGGYLVSDYSESVSSPDSTRTDETVPNTGSPYAYAFSGTLRHTPIDGFVDLVVGGDTLVETSPGSGVLTNFSSSAGGTINYTTGRITATRLFDWAGAAGAATYTYTPSGATGESTSQGSSHPIYAFNVEQQGQNLRIVDNNGSVYEGSFGSIRTTSGVDQDTAGQVVFASGDQIIGTFEASGSSGSRSVKMTGSFEATVGSTTLSGSGDNMSTSMKLTNRKIQGTWIEPKLTAEINGVAAGSVTVVAP